MSFIIQIHIVKGNLQMIQGNNSDADLREINTQYKGRCFIWTAKFKVKNREPAIWFSLKTPNRKFVYIDTIIKIH